jgi:hypothetical protein
MTPQRNGKVERKFQTLYGQIRMMQGWKMKSDLEYGLNVQELYIPLGSREVSLSVNTRKCTQVTFQFETIWENGIRDKTWSLNVSTSKSNTRMAFSRLDSFVLTAVTVALVSTWDIMISTFKSRVPDPLQLIVNGVTKPRLHTCF